MKYKRLVFIIVTIYLVCTCVVIGQVIDLYGGIDTKNALSYKVKEIIVKRFGGRSTEYNVSDLKLISKVDLGPGNIRIITPIYRDGTPSRTYYVETMAPANGRTRSRKANKIYEITAENNQVKIGNNTKVDPVEKAAILRILNKSVSTNSLPYIKPKTSLANQNTATQNNQSNQKVDGEKPVIQQRKEQLERVLVSNEVSKKRVTAQLQSKKTENNLRDNQVMRLTDRDNKLRLVQEKVAKARLLRNQVQLNKTKENNSIIRARKEATFKSQNNNKVLSERVVVAKSPRATIQSNSVQPSSLYNNVETRNSNRLRLLKEKEQREISAKVVDKNKATKQSRVIELKLKSKKEPKIVNERNTKYRRTGAIKVADESSDLGKIRYDKTKDVANIKELKDSIEINRKKRGLSSNSFKVNKLRNSKSTDGKSSQDSKDDIAARSNNRSSKNKRERKVKLASVDSPKTKTKKTTSSKGIEENKESSPKPHELVMPVSKIKAVANNSRVTQNTSTLKPGTLFVLSSMATKSIIKAELPLARPNTVVVNVIETYERVAKKGYKSVDMFQKIADSYFFKDDMVTAVFWYEKLFGLTDKLDPVYYFRYGSALQKVGKVGKGEKMMEKFNQLK